MKRFFTKIFLTITAFSLFIGVASVAFGAEEPATVSGVCNIRNTYTDAPTFYLPDVGVGYAKKANPGVNTISELRQVCTKKVYQDLLRQYCKQNTEPASPEVITYGEDGEYQSVGGSSFGSEPMSCPVEEVPTDEEVSVANFPISELGNCGSEGECHDYCEDLEHASACVAYAKANNLLTEEEEKTLEEFSDVIENGGPGGCKTEESCGAYCEDTANLKECLEFVKKHNLLNDDEIKEVEKAVDAIENGGPGGCTKEEECRIYCEDIDHIEECVDFADKFDLVTPDELEEMRKMADVKKSGAAFPGNCKTKESCLKYCDNSANAVVCMEFALKAGFIPKEDAEAVSKIIPYLKSGGKMPGGCATKESCDTYCGSEAHASECADFAVGAGFMTEEEGETIKRTGGKSPGNCRSKEACENYCNDEAHIDECVDFAVSAGFISQEEAEMAKKFKITSGPGGCKGKAECESFCITNQEVCIKWGKEHGIDMGGGQGGPGTAEECAKFGGNWDGKKCELGASECVKQGGSWGPDKETGKETCNFSGGTDPDFKECLAKPTCEEFVSCLNPSGSQSSQSGQGGEHQGEQGRTPPDLQKRMDSCQGELKEIKMKEVQEKMDACLTLSCSEFEACTKSLQQGSGEQDGGQQGAGDHGQQQGQGGENTKFNVKMNACQEELKEIKTKEIQAKMDACLTRSCSEFDACIKSVQGGGEQGTGDQGGQQQEQGQGTPDPKIEAKAKACQQEKVNACLSKPCSEFQACLNSLGGGGEQKEGEGGGTPDPAVQSKFMTCFPPPPQNQGGDGGPQSLLMEKPFLGAILRFLFK